MDDDGKVLLEGDVDWLAVAAVLLGGLTVLDTAEEEEAAAGASEVAAAPEESPFEESPPEESPPNAASLVGVLHDPNTA